MKFVQIILTLGNLQGQYSKIFSLVILSIILWKSSYYTKFFITVFKKEVAKISQLDKPAVSIMSIKQSKHKINAVNTACRGHTGV